MEYKIGDKFQIEIGRIYKSKDKNGNKKKLYAIKGFNALVFDEYGLEQMEHVDEEEHESFYPGEIVYRKARNEYLCAIRELDQKGEIMVECYNTDRQIIKIPARELKGTECYTQAIWNMENAVHNGFIDIENAIRDAENKYGNE